MQGSVLLVPLLMQKQYSLLTELIAQDQSVIAN